MLKRLTLRLFFQMTIVAVLLPNHASASIEKAAQTNTKEMPTPAPQPVKDHAQINNYASSQTESQPAPKYKDPAWLGVIVNGILALITAVIAAAGFIQAVASKSAAKAALKQGDHLIASDRAWLVIKSSMPKDYEPRSYGDKFELWWSIKNTGATPALNIVTQCRYQLVHGRHLTELPEEPDYPLPIDPDGSPIPPGDSMEFMTFLTWEGGEPVTYLDDTSINTIKLELNHLRVYGYVKYQDVFGNKRESRFCERFVWPLDTRRASGFRRLLGIPAAYTRHT